MLYDKIYEDMKTAMKNKDTDSLSTIRFLKSAIDLEAKNAKKDPTDELVITIVSRQIKTHKASIVEFENAGRTDLSSKLQTEISLLEKYLPEQLSNEEIEVKVNEVIKAVNPTSKRDLGRIMKELSPLKGKADFGYINKLINEKLSNLE